ncbi:MAG: winged helix-turn-helix domain-containing protein [Terriglobales bacterium]
MSATLVTMPRQEVRARYRPEVAAVWRGHAAVLRQELQSMASLLTAMGAEAAHSADLTTPQVTADAWTLDLANLELRGQGRTVAVTFLQALLLRALMEHSGVCISRAALLRLLIGVDGTPEQLRNVDQHITRLRRRLGPAAACLQTVRGVGFRWSAADNPEVRPCQ